MNTKFTIAYDGSYFLGSQTQPNGLGVQDAIVKAFLTLNIDTKIVLSGRTDKNVHATGQVFSCEIPPFWSDLNRLKEILNKHLPSSIKVKSIVKADEDFHARFSAKRRVYRYIVTKKELSPFNSKYLSFYKEFDEELIKRAIKCFIGKHDFDFFHKTGSDENSTVREIYSANFYRYKNFYVFRFCANSYLRSQIRLMVAFLLKVGEGKLSIEDLKHQLNKDKRVFKTPASPFGLYLAKVEYR